MSREFPELLHVFIYRACIYQHHLNVLVLFPELAREFIDLLLHHGRLSFDLSRILDWFVAHRRLVGSKLARNDVGIELARLDLANYIGHLTTSQFESIE